jgi:hypothetical protein
MIRPVLTEIGLFVTPFVLYAAYLIATRAGVFKTENWPWSRVAWLTIVAFVLMTASFLYFANYTGAPVGTTYVPAHMENGKFVPGQMR